MRERTPDWENKWPGFPKNCCGLAVEALLPTLEQQFPSHGFRRVHGYYRMAISQDGHRWRGHTWIEAGDGTIIDPTLGQFIGGTAARIVRPTSSLYQNYRKD